MRQYLTEDQARTRADLKTALLIIEAFIADADGPYDLQAAAQRIRDALVRMFGPESV